MGTLYDVPSSYFLIRKNQSYFKRRIPIWQESSRSLSATSEISLRNTTNEMSL